MIVLVINEIHIYGYGKLEELIFKDLTDFTIIYGENEAGKSTIMSFIHSILFGFPLKFQPELRYEPKKLTRYGGKLVVTFPQVGKAIIERVKGNRAIGDVTVTLSDGTQGGEELLGELLSNIDKSLFQAIFSFNLHGLQNVQQMKNEDLGKFLFSTGTLGTDRLLGAENTLQKELDSRYKPNGKKPALNEKITEIKGLYTELKEAELSNEQYWLLIKERDALETELKKCQEELLHQQSYITKLNEWQRLLPIVREQLNYKEELEALQESGAFPNDGVNRYEEIKRHIIPLENKIAILKARIMELQQELEEADINPQVLTNELAIYRAVENLPLYDQLKQERQKLDLALKEIKDEISAYQGRLHLSIDESKILNSNTSVFMKEKTANAWRKEQRLKEKKLELDELFHEAKQELETLETKITQVETEVLPVHELAELSAQKQLLENRNHNEEGLFEIQEKMKRLNGRLLEEEKQEKLQQRQSFMQTVLFSIIFISLAGWSLFDGQWIILLIALSGLAYVLFFRKRQPRTYKKTLSLELTELAAKERELKKNLNQIGFQDMQEIISKLKEDEQKREQLSFLKMKWDQKNEQYEKILNAYEKWEEESHLHHRNLIQLGNELGIPNEIALSFIHDAFLLIEKLKNCILEEKRLHERVSRLDGQLAEIEGEIADFAERFLAIETFNVHHAAHLLKQEVKKQQELQIYCNEKNKKLSELEEEFRQYSQELNGLKDEIATLYETVSVDSEAEFYRLAETANRRAFLLERFNELERQLTISTISSKEREEFEKLADVKMALTSLKLDQEQRQRQLTLMQDRLAEIKYRIVVIEEGGTYTELLHQYKKKKFELNEEAKQWAKYAIAKEMLSRAVEQYKSKHLPKLMEKAESYLRFLTGNQYIRIHTPKVGGSFLIERYDRILFEPKELSQATSEQIYVSLRLAVATTVYEKYKFPIIIDDSFVNFDLVRTEKVIQLLSELTGHQILLFTCHKHILELIKNKKVIDLSEQSENHIA